MMKIFHKPVRMCIACRKRDIQDSLVRLQCDQGSLEVYKMNGRSFYLCRDCINEEKKVLRSLMRHCKSGNREKLMNKLKEIITDDGKS